MNNNSNPTGVISSNVELKGSVSSGIKITGKLAIGNYGVIDPAQVKAIVDDYLDENLYIPNFTINGEEPDENGNFVIELHPDCSNNVVEF